MYSLHDTRSSVANIFPFSDQPDAGGEFERENPRPALKHSHTRPDVPLLSAWKHGYEKKKITPGVPKGSRTLVLVSSGCVHRPVEE